MVLRFGHMLNKTWSEPQNSTSFTLSWVLVTLAMYIVIVCCCRYTSFVGLFPLLSRGTLPLVKLEEISQTIDSENFTVQNSVQFSGPLATTSISTNAKFEVRSPKRVQVCFHYIFFYKVFHNIINIPFLHFNHACNLGNSEQWITRLNNFMNHQYCIYNWRLFCWMSGLEAKLFLELL